MNKTVVIIIATTASFLVSCKKSYVEEEVFTSDQRVKSVSIMKPVQSSKQPSIIASGVLASEKEINFSFKIGGIVNKLNFEEGQTVKKGQLLAQLDLVEINAQALQAQNSYDKAKRDLTRVMNLYADTVATLEQRQDAETAASIAKASLDIAAFNLRYAGIVAPIEGKILRRYVEVDELVSPGQPIYSLGSSGTQGSQIIKIGIADKHVVRLNLADSANVRFDAFPQREYAASITEIAEEANPATGTFEIELTLNSFHQELKNGFVGYVQVFPSQKYNHYKIPITALVEGNQHTAYVFTTRDSVTVERKELKVAEIYGDFFIISKDQFSINDWLVTEGSSYLNDRDSIQIINFQ